MTLTPGETIPPAAEGTFDARRRHRGAFRLGLGTDTSTGRRPRRRPKPVLALCAAWLGLLVLLALFANVLPVKDPSAVIGGPNGNPAWGAQFFGTDAIGRSMVSRLVFGARVSLEISVLVTVVALVVGGAAGLLSAFFRGAVTFVADTIANTILSVPGLLLLLAIVVVFHPSLPVLVGAIALLYLPGFMRVTRATALSLIEREYVVAARSLGATQARIIGRELLPNTAVALVTYAALALPGAMLAEGGLSYLGFGVQPPTPSWGQMIAQGQQQLTTAPWQAIIPCLVFSITIFALYSAGDWLRARLDVRGTASD
jgi:peptide/nickel transport system permease protein